MEELEDLIQYMNNRPIQLSPSAIREINGDNQLQDGVLKWYGQYHKPYGTYFRISYLNDYDVQMFRDDYSNPNKFNERRIDLNSKDAVLFTEIWNKHHQ